MEAKPGARKKVLILGSGPLLEGGTTVVAGTNLRTWTFTAPVRDAGHEVLLLTIPIPGYNDEETEEKYAEAEYRGLRYRRLFSNNENRLVWAVGEIIAEWKPDVVIAVNAFAAFVMARVNPAQPFWADQNGWTAGEGLARAYATGSRTDFAHFWRIEALPLLRADAISTVSERQAHAVLAEMAMLGRFDGSDIGDGFVHSFCNLPDERFLKLERNPALPAILEGRMAPGASFALWSGAFNCWTNVPYFVEALEAIFAAAPDFHVVCTGGAVVGHDEVTYAEFQRLAAERLPADRLHLLGWVDFEDVVALHSAAAVGLSVDWPNLETRFGARNRLTNMVGGGIPAVTTRGSEVAEWIAAEGAGLLADPNKPQDFANAVLEIAAAPAKWQAKAARAREVLARDFAPEKALSPLLRWIDNPTMTAPGKIDPPVSSDSELLRGWVERQATAVRSFDGLAPVPAAEQSLAREAKPLSFTEKLTRTLGRLKGVFLG